MAILRVGDRVSVVPSFACHDGCNVGTISSVLTNSDARVAKDGNMAVIRGYLIEFRNGMKKFVTDGEIEVRPIHKETS